MSKSEQIEEHGQVFQTGTYNAEIGILKSGFQAAHIGLSKESKPLD